MAPQKEVNNVDVVGELQKEVTTTQLHPKSVQVFINSILPNNERKEGCSGNDDDIEDLKSDNNELEEKVSDNLGCSGNHDDIEELESSSKNELEERVWDNSWCSGDNDDIEGLEKWQQ